MRPRLDQLEALLWIVRLGSFRAAARQLHLSQPAISGRIRELEGELGFAVVDRTEFRPGITPKGAEVVRYAEQMIVLAEGFRRRLAEPALLPTTIRMGAADSFALTLLSALLTRIAERHPGMEIELTIEFSAGLDRKLHAGELDIAFLTAPSAGHGVTIEPLLDLELAWLASPRFELPARRLTPADLAEAPIITNPRPSHLYGTIQGWFAAAGLVPKRLHTCTSLPIIANLTGNAFGIAVLPPTFLKRELASGRLNRLTCNPSLPMHHIAVAWRSEAGRMDLRPLAEIAQELVRRVPARTGRPRRPNRSSGRLRKDSLV
jgi:DNA-binding transcriptional LysR family regulator